MSPSTYDVRPRVAVSQCLGFKAVRYNGAIIRDDFVQHLAQFADVVELCPEVGIGLGVPRDPIRMQRNAAGSLRLYQPATQRDITDEMHAYAHSFLDSIDGKIDGFILKSRSPSCGIARVSVFDAKGDGDGGGGDGGNGGNGGKGEQNDIIAANAGMFAQHVLQRFSDVPVQDEMQLKLGPMRADFLTRAWASARLRTVSSMHELITYHATYKYLLMSYNAGIAKSMGQLLGRMTSHTHAVSEYRALLASAMRNPPTTGSWLNAVTHMFGHVSERADGEWRAALLSHIDALRDKDSPKARTSVTQSLHAMAVRLDEPYLKAQHFFQPFPSELA